MKGDIPYHATTCRGRLIAKRGVSVAVSVDVLPGHKEMIKLTFQCRFYFYCVVINK